MYTPGAEGAAADGPMARFMAQSGNSGYQTTVLTWFNLFVLVIAYPAMQLLGAGDTTTNMLKDISAGGLAFVLLITILFLWTVFMFNYTGAYLEGTGLAGLGLARMQKVDFAWAGAFLLGANLILSGLAWVLAQIGLPMSGEISLLIPTDPAGKVIWVLVSFTAGFCEEIAFRGYLMTRLRLIFKTRTWILPIIISTLAFGICHAYQGWPGFIIITVYGFMFAMLYIRTGRLWPCIIAHFFQDFGALFFPQ